MVTSSGMSALFINFTILPHGSKILCGDDVYGGTYRLLNTIYNDRFEIKIIQQK
ncbi:MAG: hypothetical protein CM15mP107_2440 [Bacteroidota bacterium]|nr:MAG: hypothetical protein CM15mP107_2440 [Bacteroidota bacterium]